MSREDRIIRERVNRDRLSYPVATTDHVKYIKDTIITALRDVFSRDPDYTYITDETGIIPDFENPRLGMVITDVYQYEVEFLPVITIRVNSGNMMPVSFNQNQFTYDYLTDPETGLLARDELGRPIELYQEYAGLYQTTATLSIHTWSPLDREKLSTRLCFMFQHLLRDQLYADFGMFATVSGLGGETETPYSNDFVFSQTVNLSILTGWNNRIPANEEVEAVNLQIIGDAVSPSEPGKSVPSKKDLEDSPRVDWVTEFKTSPVLALSDALDWHPDGAGSGTFTVTDDWIEVLDQCGITIEDATAQINSGSWLRERLMQNVAMLRQRADVARNNTGSAICCGSLSEGLRYRLPGGMIVESDGTVIFPHNVRVDSNNNVLLNSGIAIDRNDDIHVPGDNIDFDSGANPFTATSFTNLDAYNFFLILLYVESPCRQSIYGLSKLIDEYKSENLDVIQQNTVDAVYDQVSAIYEYRILHGRIIDFESPEW